MSAAGGQPGDAGCTAVYGGSFDPPHVAHVLAAAYVLATQPVDRVLVVPTFAHPFGKQLTAFEHRVTMCARAFGDLSRVSVSSVERELGAPSWTVNTLRTLVARSPGTSFRFVVGSDILAERDRWNAWDEIVSLAPPIVLGRIGHAAPDAPDAVLPAVASRDVRARLARNETVHAEVPRSVLAYIADHGLYRAVT